MHMDDLLTENKEKMTVTKNEKMTVTKNEKMAVTENKEDSTDTLPREGGRPLK